MTDPGAGARDPGVILGDTVLPGLAFVVFGIIAALLVAAAERQPILSVGLFMLFAAFGVRFFGLLMVVAQSFLGTLVWWNIFIGNLLAVARRLPTSSAAIVPSPAA